MTEVIKRDGRREAFSADKLRRSIEAAAKEARLPAARVGEVVDSVASVAMAMAQKETEIRTSVIRQTVLGELDRMEPAVSEAWRNFDRAKPSRR